MVVDARSILAAVLLYHLMPDTKSMVNHHRIVCLVPVSEFFHVSLKFMSVQGRIYMWVYVYVHIGVLVRVGT